MYCEEFTFYIVSCLLNNWKKGTFGKKISFSKRKLFRECFDIFQVFRVFLRGNSERLGILIISKQRRKHYSFNFFLFGAPTSQRICTHPRLPAFTKTCSSSCSIHAMRHLCQISLLEQEEEIEHRTRITRLSALIRSFVDRVCVFTCSCHQWVSVN